MFMFKDRDAQFATVHPVMKKSRKYRYFINGPSYLAKPVALTNGAYSAE